MSGISWDAAGFFLALGQAAATLIRKIFIGSQAESGTSSQTRPGCTLLSDRFEIQLHGTAKAEVRRSTTVQPDVPQGSASVAVEILDERVIYDAHTVISRGAFAGLGREESIDFHVSRFADHLRVGQTSHELTSNELFRRTTITDYMSLSPAYVTTGEKASWELNIYHDVHVATERLSFDIVIGDALPFPDVMVFEETVHPYSSQRRQLSDPVDSIEADRRVRWERAEPTRGHRYRVVLRFPGVFSETPARRVSHEPSLEGRLPDGNPSGTRSVELLDSVDRLFEKKFGSPLFGRVPHEAALVFARVPTNKMEFAHSIQTLATYVEAIAIPGKKSHGGAGPQPRSIDALEILLKPDRDVENEDVGRVIAGLRMIRDLRNNLHPAHVENAKVVNACRAFGISYPVSDWGAAWRRVLDRWELTLEGLVKMLK